MKHAEWNLLKHRFLALVLLLLMSLSAYSTTIDSLKNLLQTYKADENRVQVLNQLAATIYFNDATAARGYGEEALALAKELKDTNGQLESYYQLANACYFLSLYKEAIQSAQDCIALCQQTEQQQREADVNYIKGRSHFSIGEITAAETCYETCRTISEKIAYRAGIGKAAKGIGDIFDTKGDLDKALENYALQLKIALEDEDKIEQMISYNDHGRISEYLGKTEGGLKNYLLSLSIAEEIGHFHGAGAAAGNIGALYFIQKDDTKALEYTFKALENHQKANNLKGMAYAYQDIGQLLNRQNNLEEALVYYQKALDIRTTLGDKRGLSYTYFGMGSVFKKKKDWQKARQYYEKSLALRTELGFKMGITSSYKALGLLLMESGEYSTAFPYLKKAQQIAEELGATEELEATYSSLSQYYEKTQDFRNAFTFQKIALIYHDSLFSKDKNKQFALMQTKYETEKKEKQILQQEKDILALERANALITAQKNYSLIGLFIVGLLGFFGFQTYQMKKEQNDKIAFTKALIYAQEEERKRIASDLHDGVGQSLLLLKKQMETTHETTFGNQRLITEALEEIRSISRNLHPFQLEKFGLTAAIQDVIYKIEHSTDLFITKEIDNIDKLLSAKAAIQVYRIIQEALNNVVKHSDATAAKIHIEVLAKDIKVLIQDNGKGFDFELAIVQSKSLGLRTMHERISNLGGKLKIERGVPKGTTVVLSIPVSVD